MLDRRTSLLALASLATLGPSAARANNGAPLRLLVGFPPGGGTDAIARVLAESLQPLLGQTVIVENKPGAGGQLAAQALKAAAPDGNTLFLSHDHSISILPLTLKNPGFNPQQDFAYVAGFATFANAVALSGGTQASNFKDYIALLKRQGGRGNVGIPAAASVPEFLVKTFGEKFGLELVAAPYRGSAPMLQEMMGNQIGAGVGSVPDFITAHRDGKIRIVGVMGRERQGLLPDVPTFAELGLKGFEELPYYGLFAPAGTPAAVQQRISTALAKVLADRSVYARLTALGLSVAHVPGEELAKRERAYSATWAGIMKAAGFKPQ